MKLFLFIFTLAGFSAVSRADAPGGQDIENYLREFQKNPASAMQKPAKKWGHISKKRIADSDELFRYHAEIRARIMARSHHAASAPIDADQDDPADIVENPESLVRNIDELDSLNVRTGSSNVAPWSSHYWPFYLGVAANRYGDPLFPQDPDWKANRDYTRDASRTLLATLERNDSSDIDLLSPAEKYDAILGNTDGPLTQAMWKATKKAQNSHGKVPDWEGICEGWSSAAIRVPRPAHTVTIQDSNGRAIHFYPADIKALSSLLWAWGEIPSRFVGGRCDQKKPKKDENGRITDPDCFEANPATWHLIVTHQLGRLHHSFIIDASADNEVWNQPMEKYEYRYFNPQTGHVTDKVSEAKVSMEKFTNDKFRSYRSEHAAAVVGIAMDLTYTSENETPSQSPNDSTADDFHTTARYLYDLELDSSGQIIGGEWYHDAHPNFMWMPEPGAAPTSDAEDEAKGLWDGTGTIPASWTSAAQSAASKAQPLAKFVEVLEKMSKE